MVLTNSSPRSCMFKRYLRDVSSLCLPPRHTTLTNPLVGRGEVPFILPRGCSSEQCGQKITEGFATVLISYMIDNIDSSQPLIWSRSRTRSMDRDTESIGAGTTSDENNSSLNDSISYHQAYGLEHGLTPCTAPLAKVSFDAHVLPGRGRRSTAVLPVISVADEDNITPLLMSVLYQRCVWGIDKPAVGIVFSKTGTLGQVFLGWLDLESSNAQDLVRIRYRFLNGACTYPKLSPSCTLPAQQPAPHFIHPLDCLISQIPRPRFLLHNLSSVSIHISTTSQSPQRHHK
jgi:hypothetical protein